jgi:hypothetical protein
VGRSTKQKRNTQNFLLSAVDKTVACKKNQYTFLSSNQHLNKEILTASITFDDACFAGNAADIRLVCQTLRTPKLKSKITKMPKFLNIFILKVINTVAFVIILMYLKLLYQHFKKAMGS